MTAPRRVSFPAHDTTRTRQAGGVGGEVGGLGGTGEDEWWRAFEYADLAKRDKLNLDLFWLKDKSLDESDDLPPPGVLATEIAADMGSATDRFAAIAGKLGGG